MLNYFSNVPLGAIIAYVKSVPPVDHTLNGQSFTPLTKIMFVLGVFPPMAVEAVSHETHVASQTVGVNVEYGKYVMDTNDCRICHGPNLNGGPFPDPTRTKISPNLTPGGELAFWSEDEFINTIRTGVTPGGHELDNEFMPWNNYRNMTDDELKAIWLYLQSVPKMDQYTE